MSNSVARSNWKRKATPPASQSSGGDDGSSAIGATSAAAVITLPPDMYWNHVCAYIPVEDRPKLYKRTCGTQLYAGERVEIDANFLEKQGRVLGFTGIPRATGTPGSWSFHVSFDEHNNPTYDADDTESALDLLRSARRVWDEHLSKLTCPATRLHACLNLFCDEDYPDTPMDLPLFFLGNGSIKEVVQFHVSMNPRCINGPALTSPGSRGGCLTSLKGGRCDENSWLIKS